MDKDIKNLFYKEEEKKNNKDTKNIIESIPYGYIPIEFDSCGKLGYPEKLHFRNYNIEESLLLSNNTSGDIDNLKNMIQCLNNMVYEKFDCSLFCLEDVITTVYNIQLNFWKKTLDMETYNKDIEDKYNEKNMINVEVPITSLKTKLISETYKDPFFVEKEEKKIYFEYPRVFHLIKVQEYIENKYKYKLEKLSSIIVKIQKIESIKDADERDKKLLELDQVKLNEVKKLTLEKINDIQKYNAMMILKGVDDLVLETVVDKIQYIDKNISFLDYQIWDSVFNFINDEIQFGIQEEVTFYSTVHQKEIIRRFQFRYLDFIPDFNSKEDSKYIIHFK